MDLFPYLEKKNEDYFLKVKLKPNSKENKIKEILSDGTVKIQVKAPALENKANQELICFLGQLFKVAKSHIEIVKGRTSSFKTVLIRNIRRSEKR
ncbi:YggU family protein [bacterium]|nr:YggU family protein [bacterium]